MLIRRGGFDSFRVSDSRSMINEASSRTITFSESAIRSGSGLPVFISYKHSDLEDLEGLLGMLKNDFKVNPYLDCLDDGMPLETCANTAIRIKQVIGYCPKFILLATEDALSSRWCNWEVGIADKLKLPGKNMAILPVLDKGQQEEDYKGNEYLRIYPHIEKVRNLMYNGFHYQVTFPSSSGGGYTTLRNWLQ